MRSIKIGSPRGRILLVCPSLLLMHNLLHYVMVLRCIVSYGILPSQVWQETDDASDEQSEPENGSTYETVNDVVLVRGQPEEQIGHVDHSKDEK